MVLQYNGKRTYEEILASVKPVPLKVVGANVPNWRSANLLILGDNSRVMATLLKEFDFSGKVNLVYIDPPFATRNTYRIASRRGATISTGSDDEVAYSDALVGYEYLEFLRERLVLLRELMSSDASIYLHIDSKIGHYVKIIMDEIFGPDNFRNDITRIKCKPKNFPRLGYSNIKDIILFYSKGRRFVWHEPKVGFRDEDIERLYPKMTPDGRRYTTIPLHAPGETKNGSTGKPWRGLLPPKGRHWRCAPEMLDKLDAAGLIEWSSKGIPRRIVFADEAYRNGKRLQDVWDFKDPQYPLYPTEKNLEMLKTIIRTSSNEGALVLDCFAGSGTTLIAAQELGRRWIGIDNSHQAIATCLKRLTALKPNIFAQADFVYLEARDD
ncbi:MAG: site-specific DNA-methyltransferase [candidate division WOR-3 bacterium]|uniref:Site-specific DNA-methyltransferase n=1 Tax=candidate division WOR-3 bacterium TaxID=2052148 RepID=A0A7C1NBC4_UNCW3|nr:site-specific DNA-methyltransferase [candidate division WOR-3 bacterium]